MSSDPLQYFAWSTYILFGVLYSVFVLVDSPSKKGGLIFTKRNARPIWMIIAIHFTFLIILLELMRVATHFYYSLPNWLTDELHRFQSIDISDFDILFVLVMVAMFYLERRFIFKASEDTYQTLSDRHES